MNYIIDFNPYQITNPNPYYLANIETNLKNNESITNQEAIDFLNTISYLTRYKKNPKLNNYDNKCDTAQSILYYYLKNLNLKVLAKTTQHTITNNIIGHNFLVVELIVESKKKHYLLDPTYIQFFKKDKCTKENYYINSMYPDYLLLTPDPGFFIQESMKQSASFLLNHGFIPLNEDTAKMYGDSFYNTKTGPITFNLTFKSIPGEIYLNAFLNGSESLSISEEKLIELNLNITPFNDIINNSKKR